LHNDDIAAVFEEIADLLDLQAANPFRIRAYRRAALMLRGLPRDVATIRGGGGDLRDLPGIGEDLAAQIDELLRTGRDSMLVRLRREFPRGAAGLLRLPGLGPKRVRTLIDSLRIGNVTALRRALRQGRLRGLPGFGPALIDKLRGATAPQARAPIPRMPRASAGRLAAALVSALRKAGGVKGCEIAGSYRRGRDTVGDLDLVVCAPDAGPVRRALERHEGVRRLTAAGPTRLSAVFDNGLQVDVRVVPAECYGAALHYFTGSKAHNIRVRAHARQMGLRISEYGVFRGTRRLAGASEQDVFDAVGLDWTPPELREDRGEFEAALAHRLPRLVTRADLLGDLHTHTRSSDGALDLEALALAARSQGLKYLAITDHARHLGIVHGLDAGALARQGDDIDALNARLRGITLLKGVEVDILPDGSLALPDAVLRRLDVVVAAVHTQLGAPRARQTARLLKALDRPCVSILAHPTGRLLGEREPMQFDLGRVLRTAAARPCYVELNTQPQRLDLDDVGCREARDAGVLVSIASDAHVAAAFATLESGVLQARRGWLEPAHVLNAQPLPRLRRLLQRTLCR